MTQQEVGINELAQAFQVTPIFFDKLHPTFVPSLNSCFDPFPHMARIFLDRFWDRKLATCMEKIRFPRASVIGYICRLVWASPFTWKPQSKQAGKLETASGCMARQMWGVWLLFTLALSTQVRTTGMLLTHYYCQFGSSSVCGNWHNASRCLWPVFPALLAHSCRTINSNYIPIYCVMFLSASLQAYAWLSLDRQQQ